MISQSTTAPGTTAPRKNPPAHDPASWSMLDRLARGVVSPLSNLRDAIDLTLEQVADWLADAKNRRRINNLLMLLNVQAQLLLSEHRLLAAERLLDVINDPKAAPETVRRACSDLLKTNLVDLVELRRNQKWEGESDQETERRRDGETKWEQSEVGGQRSGGTCAAGFQPAPGTDDLSKAGKMPAPQTTSSAGRMPAPQGPSGKGKAAGPAREAFRASMLTYGLAPPASSSIGSGGGPSGLHSGGGGGGGAMFIAHHGEVGSLNGDVLK